MRKIELVIEGEPVAKGRPKLSRYGTYTPKKTKDYEELVKKAWNESKYADFEPLETAIKISVVFYRGIQKSGSKQIKDAKNKGLILPTIKPDIDNYMKSILDGLNGLAYVDDSQVCSIKASKMYSAYPRVEVVVEEIEHEG